MRFTNSNTTFKTSPTNLSGKSLHRLSMFCALAMVLTGCQSIKSSPLVQKAGNFGRKNVDQTAASDKSPANRRKPFSLDAITGTRQEQPPVRPSSLDDFSSLSPDEIMKSNDPPTTGLNLENVGLGLGKVQIEPGSMDEATRSQLPAFVESAVNPLGSVQPPTPLSVPTSVPVVAGSQTNLATNQIGDSMNPGDPLGTVNEVTEKGIQPVRMSLGDANQNRQAGSQADDTHVSSMGDQATDDSIPSNLPLDSTQQAMVSPSNQVSIVQASEKLAQQTQPSPNQNKYQLNDSTFSNQVQTTHPASQAAMQQSPTYILDGPKNPNSDVPQESPSQHVVEQSQPTMTQPTMPQSPQISTSSPSLPAKPVQRDDGTMMRIVADTTGQRKDGMSSSVARLFEPQKKPVASPIPGRVLKGPSPVVQQISYQQEENKVESATYSFSDSHPLNTTGISTTTETGNSASLLAPPAPIRTPKRLPRMLNRSTVSQPSGNQPRFNQPKIVNQPNAIQPTGATWGEPLDAAIRQLDLQLSKDSQGDVEIEQRIRLHLMKMIAGEHVSDRLDLAGIDPARQQFWEHQLRALEILLTQNHNQNVSAEAAQRRRATMAAEQLALASDQLANDSGMRLRNCAFSTEVLGFGQIQEAQFPFRSGQQLLIYCEIENYSLRQFQQTDQTGRKEAMLQAELQGLYSIIDESNRVVHQFEYQPVKDIAQRRRNDFYMFFPVTLPKLAPGKYELHLSVEDRVGGKVASCLDDLSFEIIQEAYTASNRDTQSVPIYGRR